MGEIRYGPSGLPEAPTFDEAFAALTAERYRACETGFVSGFWLDYEDAPSFGSLDDVLAMAGQVDFVRPVLDFAHMHATSDGAFLEPDLFADALARTDAVLEPDAPFHIHFSDIQFANRNETKHLPYGEGTLRAEPLRDALARFERPATVISESPDEASTQTIGTLLLGESAARRTS